MAETKEKKGFRAGLYGVIVGIVIAVILVVLTIFAFTTRYTAFSPEKVAQAYTDTIVQTGDGYNAYKNTLVSKNDKYGDFIRKAYMAPYVNEYKRDENGDYLKDEKGKLVKVEQAEFVGTGSAEEAAAIDEVYNTMYDYYVSLLNEYGLDDYDSFYNSYFAKLVEVRKAVYGDEFMNTEYMFGAFEANVDAYGKSLTGTEEKLAADNKTVLQEKTTGVYQNMFGEKYRFTTTVTSCDVLSEADAKAYVEEYAKRIAPVAQSGEAKADSLGLKDIDEKNKPKTAMVDTLKKLDNSESITGVAKAQLEVKLDDGKVVATQELYVVQIGNSWYVDNTNIDTSALYLAK